MFYQDTNWVSAKEYDRLVDKYNRLSEVLRENRLLGYLYLYLSNNKNLIEEKAYSLADKHGLLGALQLLRTRNKV